MTQNTQAQCEAAVATYLKKAAKFDTDASQKVVKGDTISVDYIGRLHNGEVFDTSIEEVAKDCNLYTDQREYGEGLSFEVGAGKMIEGFDKAVVDMSLGETKTIEIPAIEAYGEEASFSIERSQLQAKPDGSDYVVGDMLMTQMGPTSILALDEDTVEIANPNPLAGKDLIFDITIKSID